MAIKRCEVRWDAQAPGVLVEIDDQQRGDAALEYLLQQAALPSTDARGRDIDYRLFRIRDQAQPEPIKRRVALSRIGIEDDEILYIAMHGSYWWGEEASQTPARGTLIDTSTCVEAREVGNALLAVPADPPPILPPPEPHALIEPITATCIVELVDGVEVAVPAEGLDFDRQYLLANLPQWTRLREEIKFRLGMQTALDRVTRQRHCRIQYQDGAWVLVADQPTFVYGHRVDPGRPQRLTRPATVRLGHESRGWPLKVRIETPSS